MAPATPSLSVTRYDDPSAFLAAATEVLSREEALNGLALGIADALAKGRKYGDADPLLVTVERDGEPIGAALETPPYNLTLSRMGAAGCRSLAHWLLSMGHAVPGVTAEVDVARAFAGVYLRPPTVAAVRRSMRLFELRAVLDAPHPGGRMRRAEAADRAVVQELWEGFRAEATPEAPGDHSGADFALKARNVFLWVDDSDMATSLAARNRELPTGASIGPVYTPSRHRAKGYATALVAELSRAILADGKAYACLFTDLSNPVSNSIYPKVGYEPIGDVVELEFG
jgi:hypothetical protein